jgi:hypothetical protein
MTGAIAVDFFSIATCEVSEAGSSLTVRGERTGSAFNRMVPTLSPKPQNAFLNMGKRDVLI